VTPLAPPHGPGDFVFWRLDQQRFAPTWDSGEGAFQAGGRWNPVGIRAVYCALDPATAILEIAVHKTFQVLDTMPHTLTSARINDPSDIFVVDPASVPNANWLRPGMPGAGQQAFGGQLLATHVFVLIPSAVSTHSWNLLFDNTRAAGAYRLLTQEPFALDTRLHPAVSARAPRTPP
jgi:RES domain-containing protein